MKTFETEKGNIPEGATHFMEESCVHRFAWAMYSGGDLYLRLPEDLKWTGVVDKFFSGVVDKIPQTNVETPEEKDVEWVNGLPPVGVECEVMIDTSGKWRLCEILFSSKSSVVVVKLKSGSELAIDPFESSFRKTETEAERVERERLESGKALHSQASKTEVATEFGIFRLWEMEDKETRDHYCQLAERINYRKESE